MAKFLVETTGKFMLMGEWGEIPSQRPAVIKEHAFVQERIVSNQIKVLGKLKDEATDADFLTYWKEAEGDAALAVESFLSAFGVDGVSEK